MIGRVQFRADAIMERDFAAMRSAGCCGCCGMPWRIIGRVCASWSRYYNEAPMLRPQSLFASGAAQALNEAD